MESNSKEKMVEQVQEAPKPLTRIYIDSEGDVVITDAWDEIFEAFCTESGGGPDGKYCRL